MLRKSSFLNISNVISTFCYSMIDRSLYKWISIGFVLVYGLIVVYFRLALHRSPMSTFSGKHIEITLRRDVERAKLQVENNFK